MRLRTLAAALALAAGTAGLTTGTAAAAQPYTPVISCDPAAGTVSTSVHGGLFVAGRPVTVQFTVRYGSAVPAGSTTARTIPQLGSVTTVPATVAADGTVSAAGYTRPWRAADFAFYTETVRVRVLDAAGTELNSGDASCTRDTRAGATLTCDPVARSVTAAAAATGGFAPGGRTRLEYRVVKAAYQSRPGDPVFVGGGGSSVTPEAVHTVTADAAGRWADTGYVHLRPSNSFYQEWLEVTGYDQAGVVVVRSAVTCSFTAA